MDNPWSCIVITCPDTTWVNIFENALQKLKDRKQFHSVSKKTVVLIAPDPGPNIGSGAATLNALYVVSEYLSAKKNYTAVSADVLKGVNILILHHGREYVYDVGGKGLINIPGQSENDIQSNLENLISFTHKLYKKYNGGVWVCSTDASFVSENLDVELKPEPLENATVFSVKADVEYATRHGTVIAEDHVEEIVYCGSKEYLEKIAQDNQVDIISGIVYLPYEVVENLLNFHSIEPLSNCTYIGIDGGNEPLKISLFFDILVAMIRSPDFTESDYISGRYGNLYNIKSGLDQQAQQLVISARKVIWSHLSKFTLKAIKLKNVRQKYWDERLPAINHLHNLFAFGKTGLHWSSIQTEESSFSEKSLIINSAISCQEVVIGHNSVISNSVLNGGQLVLGNNCFLSNLEIELGPSDRLSVLDNLAILGFSKNEASLNRNFVIFGIHDDLFKTINIETDTFCGIIWDEFIRLSGLTLGDIWPNEKNNLMNAKIFSDQIDINFYLRTHQGQYDVILKEFSKDVERYSISDILSKENAESCYNFREKIKNNVACLQISKSLQLNVNQSFLTIFDRAVEERWHIDILDALDLTVEKMIREKISICRTISCIADLLGMMAGIVGRLRSGPGNNKAWITAFDYLKNNEEDKAVTALKKLRQQWLSSNLILRAARHYESALQILIQNSVKSCRNFVCLKACPLPKVNEWISSDCPSRIDVQGGWSDTPPICYEQGGSVVNISVLLDGNRPIGAKVRRIEDDCINLYLVNGSFTQEVIVQSLEDLQDFNQPFAKGALLKAAIVCAEVIQPDSPLPLQQQLLKYKGGLEIHCWSHLPQGSGLGTSSILAGCVIAVLWTVSGRTYSKSCLIHAVLYLEQLLTTGGGWQDQIGGIMGGVNRGYSSHGLPLRVQIEPIHMQPMFQKILSEHLFLVYTGKVRLAKNLLQNVIRNWYAREENVVSCFKMLVENSLSIADAFKTENLAAIGAQINEYWKQKISLAPGCDPLVVQKLMAHLKPYTLGQCLAGAGGGGFMYILTKEPSNVKQIKDIISELPFSDTIKVHSVLIDTEGINVYVGLLKLDIK